MKANQEWLMLSSVTGRGGFGLSVCGGAFRGAEVGSGLAVASWLMRRMEGPNIPILIFGIFRSSCPDAGSGDGWGALYGTVVSLTAEGTFSAVA